MGASSTIHTLTSAQAAQAHGYMLCMGYGRHRMYQTKDGKERESRPDMLCAESTAVRKRWCSSLKQSDSRQIRANGDSGG